MEDSILARILALKTASLSELQKEYNVLYGGKKAPSNNKTYLWQRIAYRIQEALEHDTTVTARQIAEWLKMTPPRICQILDLLLLCPTIQQDVLLLQNKKLYTLGEYNVRRIVKELLWEKQIEMWEALLKSS